MRGTRSQHRTFLAHFSVENCADFRERSERHSANAVWSFKSPWGRELYVLPGSRTLVPELNPRQLVFYDNCRSRVS